MRSKKKKKFDLFARKKNLNYIAVAFTTRGADAPPMTKEEKGKKKGRRLSRKNVINAKEGPMRVDRSTMNGYSDLGRYKWGTKRKLHGFIHSFCAKLKYRLERMSLRY